MSLHLSAPTEFVILTVRELSGKVIATFKVHSKHRISYRHVVCANFVQLMPNMRPISSFTGVFYPFLSNVHSLGIIRLRHRYLKQRILSWDTIFRSKNQSLIILYVIIRMLISLKEMCKFPRHLIAISSTLCASHRCARGKSFHKLVNKQLRR